MLTIEYPRCPPVAPSTLFEGPTRRYEEKSSLGAGSTSSISTFAAIIPPASVSESDQNAMLLPPTESQNELFSML